MAATGEEREVLSFEKGLYEAQEDSLLENGQAAALENWVPESTGALRCRRGWQNASTTGAPATRKAKGIGRFSVDEVNGDVKTKVGSFAAVGTTTAQAITGVGFRPTAIIFWASTSSGAWTTSYGNSGIGVGFTTGVAESQAVAIWNNSGSLNSNTTRIMHAKAIVLATFGSGTQAEADLTSFDADGFTVTWTTNAVATAGTVINYMAFGGTDLSNAKVVSWTAPAATGTKAVTGVGFKPDVVFHTSISNATASVNTNAGRLSLGAMDSSGNQWSLAETFDNAVNPSISSRRFETNRTLIGSSMSASFTSMDSDGFTTNFDTTTSGLYVVSLCLDFSTNGRVKVGSFTTGGVGSQATTGVGFQPKGLFTAGVGDTATGTSNDSITLIGGTSGTTSSKVAGMSYPNNTANNPSRAYAADKAVLGAVAANAATVISEADLTSFDSDGFTLNYTTASSSGYYVGYVAVGGRVAPVTDQLLVAHDDTTNVDIYALDMTNLDTAAWSAADANITVASAAYPVAFATGLGATLYTSRKFSTIRRWDGSTAAEVTNGPPGRCLVFHKNRFFTAGAESNSTRLFYTDLADYTSWPITNYIDVGKDDGEAIEDMAAFEDGLLIAKRNSLWFLSGSGPDSFSLHPLNGGGGYAGRCILATPYGALIAGARRIWIWTGGGVDVASLPIEESYSLDGTFVSSGFLSGVAYFCDEDNGNIYALDMKRGSWWMEKTASPTTEGPAVVAGINDYLFYGPQASTSTSLVAYRRVPDTPRDRDELLAETFVAHTPEYWLTGPGAAVSPKYLHVRIRQRGGDASDTPLTITPYYDGVAQTAKTITPRNGGAQVFRVRLDIGSRARVFAIQFRIQHATLTTDAALMDIEEMELEFDIEEVA